MVSVVQERLGRFPVVTRPVAKAETKRPSASKSATRKTTPPKNVELPDISEMRTVLLLAAYPIEESDSSWIVSTNDSVLRRLPIAADKYRLFLNSLPKEEVARRYKSYLASKRFGLLIEVSYRNVCRKPYWTCEEAAFYSFGLEFPGERGLSILAEELGSAAQDRSLPIGFVISRVPKELAFLAHVFERIDFVKRAVSVKEMPEKIPPGHFIRWAERRGIGLPYKLLSGAKDVAAEIQDWQDRYEAVQRYLIQTQEKHEKRLAEALNESVELKKDIARLQNLTDTLVRTGDGPRLRRKEFLENAQIMLICVAKEKYSLDKSMDAAARQISAATASYIDGGVGPDAVKNCLKEAQALIDGPKRRPTRKGN